MNEKLLLMKVVDHIKKETSWNEFICSLTKEELKDYLNLEDYYTYHAEKFIAKNGINRISLHEKTEDGIMIGAWLDRQRRIYRTLTTEQQTKLNKIGIYEYGNTVI